MNKKCPHGLRIPDQQPTILLVPFSQKCVSRMPSRILLAKAIPDSRKTRSLSENFPEPLPSVQTYVR